MAVHGMKIGSISLSEQNQPILKEKDKKRRSKGRLSKDLQRESSLLKISLSSNFDYNEQLNAFRKEFEERQAAMLPSPQTHHFEFSHMPILGIGRFGTVRLMKRDDGQVCALKILLKETIIKEGVVGKTLMEKTVLAASNFPFVVSLIFSTKDNDYLYLGLPFAGGSDLFTFHRKRMKFSEPMARFYSAQILLALEYLHNVKCLYRDLKLENVLIEENGYLKLTDFGLAKFTDDRTTTLCGTPEYLAPEMLHVQPYGYSVDWWTFGILLYELVAGQTPFYKYNDSLNRMYSKICKGEFDIPTTFSADLRDITEGLLDVRVATRLGCLCNGISDIKCHNFYRPLNWRGLLNQSIPAPFKPRLLYEGDTSYFTKISNAKMPALSKRIYLQKFREEFRRKWDNESVSPSTGLQGFTEVSLLGTGLFGNVKLVKKKGSGELFATKVLSKQKLISAQQVNSIYNEKQILHSIRFPFHTNLEFSRKDNKFLYLGMTLAGGGELFWYHRRVGHFNEMQARFYAAQIFLALEYLHFLHLIYRDIKPENICLDSKGYVKIIDYGFTKYVPNRTLTLCGTPEYLAPEIIQMRPYGASADWWAFGILLYELVAGYSPFSQYSSNPLLMYEKICNEDCKMLPKFSLDFKNLLRRLIQPDLSKRIGVCNKGSKDIKCHSWFKKVDWYAVLNREVLPPYIPRSWRDVYVEEKTPNKKPEKIGISDVFDSF